ncbi:hypothetical protein [Geodermatophilus sp. SYSU D00710]
MPEPDLQLTPAEVTPRAAVTARGTCPVDAEVSGVLADEGSAVDLSIEDEVVASTSVTLSTGDFGPVSFTVPEETEPGTYTVTTVAAGIIGLCGSATLTVEEPGRPATLNVRPTEARAPVDVAASGTCPADSALDDVAVSFAGEVVARTSTDEDGRMEPVSFAVRAGTEPGSHIVRTDCGGEATFTVLPATTGSPTTPPITPPRTTSSTPPTTTPRTTTPTSDEPVPAPVPPAPPTPTSQPEPGPVPPAPQPEDPEERDSSTFVLPVLGILAAVALATTAGKGLRDRRGKRWVTEHVATRSTSGEALVSGPAPEQRVRAHSVRLRAERPEWTTPEEAKHADRRDHPADDDPGTALR